MKMLEPGEVVVVSFDKIKELATRIGVSIDGKLFISNYRILYLETRDGQYRRPVDESTNIYNIPISYV